MRKILVFLVLLTVGMPAVAQTRMGTVFDDNGKPMEFATIVFMKDTIQSAVAEADSQQSHFLYFINTASNFTLPKKCFFEIVYSATSRLYSANAGIKSRHLFHASIKKQLFNDRLTASIEMRNIFNSKARYFSKTNYYTTHSVGCEHSSARCIRIGLQYNFNAGKTFKKRLVESSAGDGKERLKKKLIR